MKRRAKCLLLALNGRQWAGGQCLLSGVKQTSQIHGAMSAFDPKQIFPKRSCVLGTYLRMRCVHGLFESFACKCTLLNLGLN
jgi:hypothetical protein